MILFVAELLSDTRTKKKCVSSAAAKASISINLNLYFFHKPQLPVLIDQEGEKYRGRLRSTVVLSIVRCCIDLCCISQQQGRINWTVFLGPGLTAAFCEQHVQNSSMRASAAEEIKHFFFFFLSFLVCLFVCLQAFPFEMTKIPWFFGAAASELTGGDEC